ncbi:MAG: nucleotidyltransferase domain-containing protein [Candidatus Vogelbacteria bacterium]
MEIKFSKEQIKEFEQLGVTAVYLFGSQATGQTHPLSDADFAILLNDPQVYQTAPMDVYNKFYQIFRVVLPKEYMKKRFELRRHEFDIVFLQAVSPRLQYEATRGGKVLYENDRAKRLAYEEMVLKQYCDLSHIYGIFHHALMERI